ncbi:MAG: glycosyltransferase family 2 protein [Phaeodactylibacter sp.]|nr:glycosyltransferase family 2 protein [Phaeodactylibacter sp.]
MQNIRESNRTALRSRIRATLSKRADTRPLVSIVTPAYNESAIIEKNLQRLCAYLKGQEHSFRWELVIVDDGSTDGTGAVADRFAAEHKEVKVAHHIVNRNLGGALQTGFRIATGDYIVTLDIDLSYSELHIGQLLDRIIGTDADIVLASPYMQGGRHTNVPVFRLLLSRGVNRIMRAMSPQKIHTFTGMVRVYKKDFLRKLNLKSITYSINPEILYKAMILRARIEEIPAHLDWSGQQKTGRASGMRIFSNILAGLMSGFIFRPYILFMSIGLGLLLVSLYIIAWIFAHTFAILPEIGLAAGSFEDRFGMAVAAVFQQRPYSFMVGGVTLIIALQFLGIGFLSLQNKRYFEELFHINTTILGNHLEKDEGELKMKSTNNHGRQFST